MEENSSVKIDSNNSIEENIFREKNSSNEKKKKMFNKFFKI